MLKPPPTPYTKANVAAIVTEKPTASYCGVMGLLGIDRLSQTVSPETPTRNLEPYNNFSSPKKASTTTLASADCGDIRLWHVLEQ